MLSKWVTSFLSTYALNILLQILSGKQPFFYLTEFQAAKAIESGKIPDHNRYSAFPHDDACWPIMGKCWHKEPERREEICNLLQDLNALSE